MMNRLKQIFLACFFGVIPALAQDALNVKEFTLSNGMRVMLNEDHARPTVFGAVVVRAGGKDAPNTGIAHYFEHIMFKGTDRIGTIDYPAEKVWLDSISAQYDLLAQTTEETKRIEIQKKINNLSKQAADYAIPNEFNRLISLYGGTNLNAYTSQDETVYHNSFSSQYIEQWCWLNSERLLTPVFRLFQGELETVYEEKNRAADNILSTAFEKIMEHIYKTQPYGYSIIGSTENLKNPRLSEMKEFFDKYYVGKNMGLVLSGDIDAENILPLLEKTFGRIRSGEAPERTKSTMPDIVGNSTVEIKLPIPIINAEAIAWKSVTEEHEDYPALAMALMLMTNGSAGMLDSLTNENKVLAAMMIPANFNDAGAIGAIIIPKLLGKKAVAESLVMEQIERLKKGDFTDETIETIRQMVVKDKLMAIETADDRASLMINAITKGLTWEQTLDQIEQLKTVGKDDIVRVANKYLNDNFIRFVKKFGNYTKDKLKQPGYEPIVPKNIDAESDFAKQLRQIPTGSQGIRLLDYDKDAKEIKLGRHTTLYATENTMNDIFSTTITFYRGTKGNPQLDIAVDYINQLGTDSLTRHQLEKALYKLGSTMTAECDKNTVRFDFTGWDKNFEATMRLFSHFINNVKADKEVMKELKKSVKADYKAFEEDNNEVFGAVLSRVVYGNRSPYLRQPSVGEVKAMNETQLIDVFKDLLNTETTVTYCGRKPISEVESILRSTIDVERPSRSADDNFLQVEQYQEPVIFVYNMPKARQTLFATYDICPPSPSKRDRAVQLLHADYYGGGMSSLLFQEIREFRSMAYSTAAKLLTNSRQLYPNAPSALVTVVGTQADKTMRALQTVDSLLNDMPIRQQTFDVARRDFINEIQNGYPSFRGVATTIANAKVRGINENPNKDYEEIVADISIDDIRKFHEQNFDPKHRVYLLVGNMKQMDMKRLQQMGKVLVLKKSDIIRK